MKQILALIGILLLSTILVSANGNYQAISEEGKKLSEERCPASYCLANPMKLDVELTQ